MLPGHNRFAVSVLSIKESMNKIDRRNVLKKMIGLGSAAGALGLFGNKSRLEKRWVWKS